MAMGFATISELFLYPVKSAKGVSVSQATVLSAGLAGDRRWMVIDSTGHFVTQRQKAELAAITVAETVPGLALACRGQQLELDRDQIVAAGDMREVTVWKDRVTAYDCGDAAAAFLSGTVGTNRGRPLRLVLVHQLRQVMSPVPTAPPSVVAFADGFPFLVTTEESLADLQAHIDRDYPGEATTMTSLRFRPNLVLKGMAPFAEDLVDSLQTAGGVRFQLVKPCARCVITMVDPDTGSKGAEPLRTLRSYRSQDQGILFGQNAVLVAGAGKAIAVNEEVELFMRA